MRLSLEDLMEKLGVDHVLTAYETRPWMHYDPDQGITCSAEVRMGPGQEDIETEVQFLHDHGDTIIEEDDESSNGEQQGGAAAGGMPPPEIRKKNPIIDGREQIMHMRILPSKDQQWTTVSLLVKGKNYTNDFFDWEIKGCDFFRCIIEALQMSELPDIDELESANLQEDGGFGGGRRGRVGRKSPKVKPGALLGMKKGM